MRVYSKVSVWIISLIFSLFSPLSIFCQEESKGGLIDGVDTNYVDPYPGFVTMRFYLSEKYTDLAIEHSEESTALNYAPNTTLNLGVGATVNSFSLNLAYGFRFLNPDIGQGKTRYLDLQSHMYSRKLVVDFFGQFYKGLFLDNTADLAPEYPEDYYVRPDIYEQILGLSAFYIFNNEKYSFRSGLIQNERQVKSAGSFLLGAEAYYGLILADSSIVPFFAQNTVFQIMDGAERISFFKAGPSVGYAHTFVVKRKFFLMLSLTVNAGYGKHQIRGENDLSITQNQLEVGAFGRFALGYNNRKWYLGISSVDNSLNISSDDRSIMASFGIGNVRLNYAWRFLPNEKLKKVLSVLP